MEMRKAVPPVTSSVHLKHTKKLSKNNLIRKKGREGGEKKKKEREENGMPFGGLERSFVECCNMTNIRLFHLKHYVCKH